MLSDLESELCFDMQLCVWFCTCVSLCVCIRLCICVFVYLCVYVCAHVGKCVCLWCSLVCFVTAGGSLLCQCVPVLHFLAFVFQTLKPVSESLPTGIDSQFDSSCKHGRRN